MEEMNLVDIMSDCWAGNSFNTLSFCSPIKVIITTQRILIFTMKNI